MKRVYLLLCAALCCVSLAGCAPELYERLLISAIGVDRTADGLCRVTVRAAPDTENDPELCISAEGKNVPAALEQIALQTGKTPLYSHNSLLIFGMDCAKEGLRPYLDFFIRHYESRPTVHLFLAEETAKEILTAESGDALVPTVKIASLTDGTERTGLAVSETVLDLVQGTNGKGFGAALPVLRAENGIRLGSTAILDAMQVRCTLSENETRGLLALCGTLQRGETALSDPAAGQVSVNIRRVEPEIRFTGTADDLRFTVFLSAEAEISAAAHFDGNAGTFSRLETALSERLLEYASLYLEKAPLQNGADAVGFGNVIFRETPDVWEEVSAAWPRPLANASFQLEAKSVIGRIEEEDFAFLD